MSSLKSIIEQVQVSYCRQLDRTFEKVNQPPLLIGFSAVPGAGKTTLAKKLVPLVAAVRLCRDDIRELIEACPEKLTSSEKIEVLNAVTFGSYDQINRTWPNRRVVLDASLDRSYSRVKDRLGATPLFLIRIEPIWSQIEARLSARYQKGTPGYAMIT